jgi:hypothetical protein
MSPTASSPCPGCSVPRLPGCLDTHRTGAEQDTLPTLGTHALVPVTSTTKENTTARSAPPVATCDGHTRTPQAHTYA